MYPSATLAAGPTGHMGISILYLVAKYSTLADLANENCSFTYTLVPVCFRIGKDIAGALDRSGIYAGNGTKG